MSSSSPRPSRFSSSEFRLPFLPDFVLWSWPGGLLCSFWDFLLVRMGSCLGLPLSSWCGDLGFLDFSSNSFHILPCSGRRMCPSDRKRSLRKRSVLGGWSSSFSKACLRGGLVGSMFSNCIINIIAKRR